MILNYRQARSTVKPEAIEIGKTTVFMRTDIKKETYTDDTGNNIVMWVYQEAKMTPDEFTSYANLLNSKDIIDNVNSNNQLIIMSAIADLYDEISKFKGGTSS